jgi:GT2 family glycosyltransferase
VAPDPARRRRADRYSLSRGLRSSSESDFSMLAVPDLDVSVVVPAYRGAATIVACLESVERAAAGLRAEVVVVESSGDGAAGVVRARFPAVRVIESATRLSAGAARNRGAAEARGHAVLFVDQDCVVPPDWIARMLRYLAAADTGGAGGSVGVRNVSNWSGWAVYFLEFFHHFPSRERPTRNKNFLLGCNCGYRADAIRRVAFPDRTLGEDVLFAEAMRQQGLSTIYDPTLEVRHWNRAGWGEFLAYNRKMGCASGSYHRVLNRWWCQPFLHAPMLAFIAPLIILPSIGWRVTRSRWSYLGRFLLLLPACLIGNLTWAAAFRRQVLRERADPDAVCES